MTKRMSLNPSEFEKTEWVREPLNTSSKRDMNKLKDLTLDEIIETYVAPPNDDAYFEFRSPPMMWFQAAKGYPKSHLFIKTFSLVSSDTALRGYYNSRCAVSEIGDDPHYPPITADVVSTYINSRPKFSITKMAPLKGRQYWNAWDKSILVRFRGLASEDYGITATMLWLVYSVKAMLTSEQGARYVADLSKLVVDEWDDWLNCEAAKMAEFEQFLRSFTH